MVKNTLLILVFFPLMLHAQPVDSVSHPKFNTYVPKLITPSALILAGVGVSGRGYHSIKEQVLRYRDRQLPGFYTKADDYLRFAPVVLVYGFELAGMKPKTDFINRSVILFKSELLMTGIVVLLKHTTHMAPPHHSGPGNTNFTSFPSGHTGVAFAAATVLSTEYGYRYRWVPYLSYTLASSVGALRVMNSMHYISDVLAGAGIGILSAKIAYWTHQYKWNKKRGKRVVIYE